MMNGIASGEENRSAPAMVLTSGQWFADNSAVELVSSSANNEPSLLLWQDGREPTAHRQILRDGTFYSPVYMDRSVWAAMTLPTGVADRGPTANLFSETCDLIEAYAGICAVEAAALAAWNATTWFADLLWSPPTLFLHGGDITAAMRLLLLLSRFTRHGLTIAELTPALFRSLMAAGPTLLLNQPRMSSHFHAMCCASNFRGLVLPGLGAGVIDLACSKAIFVGTRAQAQREVGIHLYLPSITRALPPLDAATQNQIKQHFQPWYLHYRLRNLPAVRQSLLAGGGLESAMGEVGRVLESCTPDSGQLKLRWTTLLQMQDQDARAARYWDPLAGMIEVLWPRQHASEKAVTMKALTALTNTLLRSRGETLEYSPEELGRTLANEGVIRHRTAAGMVVIFDRATVLRLHQLARSLGVGKKMAKCSDCEETRIPAD